MFTNFNKAELAVRYPADRRITVHVKQKVSIIILMVFVANIDFIQGWSGIAESGELPISKLVELVKPHTNVTTMAFYSFGEGLYGCLGDKL